MSITAATWDSLTGRRGVDIGTSFTRAWNERIGKTTKRSKDYPNPEYYSLRYNFKPESIDNENTGTLTPKPGGDGHVFELERPSQQNGDSHRFTATEQPSKEWECVLLWDPVLQQLTLEKLESTLKLNHEGRGGTKAARPPSATPPSSAPGPSRSKHTPSAVAGPDVQSAPGSPLISGQELEDDLEKAMTGYSDAEGEPDDDIELQVELQAAAGASTKQEEEEEEEEMEPVHVPLPPPPPPPKAKAPPKPKPKARTRPSASAKREADYDDDIEVLTFGEPTRPPKRPRRSSATYSSNTTSGNNGPALPTPAAPSHHHAAPTAAELLQPPSSSRITYAGSDSDSDESDDGGQDLAAALELELEEQLAAAEAEVEVDDDEGMEAVPLEGGNHSTGRPLSLNELFGDQSQNDDDTSSDDSDED